MSLTAKVMLGYGHGMAWKIAALASKLGFVLLVLPKLADGVFAQYAYISSIALFASLFLSFGAMDAVPTYVRGKRAIRDRLAPLVHATLAGTIAAFIAYSLGGGLWALGAAAAGCSIAYFFLAGVLRSTEPHLFELISNVPSVEFLVLALVVPGLTIDLLLVLFVATNMVVLVAVVWWSGLPWRYGRRALAFSRLILAHLLVQGNAKTLSNMLLLADFRALITAPGLLLKTLPSDAIAVAMTVGEAAWQLAMTVINRNYAAYCAGKGTLRSSTLMALSMLAAISLVGALLILVPVPIRLSRFEWPLIGWAMIAFAGFAALSELRAFLWSRGVGDGAILLVQSAAVLIQVAIVLALPSGQWIPAAAASLLVLALVCLAAAGGRGHKKPSTQAAH